MLSIGDCSACQIILFVSFTAIMPFFIGRLNSSSGVFLTVPSAVLIKTYWRALNSLTGSTAVIFSSGAIGKAQQRIVRIGNKEVFDPIVFLNCNGLFTAPSALLRAVFIQRLRLDITRMRNGHHPILRRNQIFAAQIFCIELDLRASRVAKLLF